MSMNQEKPAFSQEQIMSGLNSLSEQLRTEMSSEMNHARLKPGEDLAQSHEQRIKAAALNMTRYTLPGETPDQTQKRMDAEAERIITGGEEQVAKISGYLKMLVDFEKAFKEHGTERELRASPESAAKIQSMLKELGPPLQMEIKGLAQGIELDERNDKIRAENGKKDLAKANNKMLLLKKLAAAADIEY